MNDLHAYKDLPRGPKWLEFEVFIAQKKVQKFRTQQILVHGRTEFFVKIAQCDGSLEPYMTK